MTRRLAPACAAIALAITMVSTPAAAQRRRREPPPPPPAELSLELPEAEVAAREPYRRLLTVRASAPIELNADRRLLRLEVTPEGSRRALRCEHPDRPARLDRERTIRLEANARWQEWIDLREYCWGRALGALRAGGDVTLAFGPRRARRGDVTLRALGEPAVDHRELGPVVAHVDPLPAPEEPDTSGRVRVVLADRDARTGAGVTLRVRVLARSGTERAYVRPDRFRFVVHGPDGDVECAARRGGGTAPADLFRRLTTRSGPSFTLVASAYCPAGTFDVAGIYEVTPIVDLEQDGSRWGLDAPTGSFRGAPALVRVRRDARGYLEREPGPSS